MTKFQVMDDDKMTNKTNGIIYFYLRSKYGTDVTEIKYETLGTLYRKKSKYFLFFEENDIENNIKTKCRLEFDEEKIRIRRDGQVIIEQTHIDQKIEDGYVKTQYGIIPTTAKTNGYQVLKNFDGKLVIILDYDLHLAEDLTGSYQMKVEFKEEEMSMIQILKDNLKKEINNALIKCGYLNERAQFNVVLENSKDVIHGDYSTNAAMQLTKIARKNPRLIAEEIISHFDSKQANVDKVEIAGPGFINFFMNKQMLTKVIKEIIELDSDYGKSNAGKGQKYNVEYVSANPTGDLHLGHARGAALGDTLCRALEKAGYAVTREYYVNDAGNQINNLVLSAYTRYLQALGIEAPMPEDAYQGPDIVTLGQSIANKYGNQFVDKFDENYKLIREIALTFELDKIKQDLKMFGVEFDLFTSEQELYDKDLVKEAIDLLQEKGYIYEKEGATWFRTTDFGDDKDRVLRKSDGTFTYLTPDIANHIEKIKRGNDRLIDIWGADHHGYIARVKASIQALGYESNKLEVDVIQMVRLIKDGQEFKMSKRTGKAVTIRDLVDEVGVDATRYFFVMRSGDTQMDFDLNLATEQSNANPVYYAQYAHARTCSLLRQAEDKGFKVSVKDEYPLIVHEKEYEVIKLMGDFGSIIADSAVKRKPHLICNYINDLATAFHSLYSVEKIIDENNIEKTNEKLALIKALKITLTNSLDLIGVSAPEKM